VSGGRAGMCRRAATDSARISAHVSSLWGKVVPSEVVDNEPGEVSVRTSAPVWASVSRHDPTATPAAGPLFAALAARPEGRRAHARWEA
jgi:hypothetical protein